MFSGKLKEYILEILKAAKEGQNRGDEAYSELAEEIQRGITTTCEGKPGKYYEYLSKLI